MDRSRHQRGDRHCAQADSSQSRHHSLSNTQATDASNPGGVDFAGGWRRRSIFKIAQALKDPRKGDWQAVALVSLHGWRIIKRVMAPLWRARNAKRTKAQFRNRGPASWRTAQFSSTVDGRYSRRTTAIYAAVCGPEEMDFAERFWRASGTGRLAY